MSFFKIKGIFKKLFNFSIYLVRFTLKSEISLLDKLRIFKRSISLGMETVEHHTKNYEPAPLYTKEQIEKLIRISKGLHFHLNQKTKIRFSILIPVFKPKLSFFSEALNAAINQSSPNFEILVGFDGRHHKEYTDLIKEKNIQTPRGQLIKFYEFERTESAKGISNTTNMLARLATGDWLVLFDHDDWIRPDLLYRYEQTIYLFNQNPNLVLYCNEYKIDEKSNFIPGSILEKPLKPEFPYLFINWICHCLAVPKSLWLAVGGLKPDLDGAQDYDLVLRLDLVGAKFSNVPFLMYAWRSHSQSTAKNLNQKPAADIAGNKAISEYIKQKKLKWELLEGPFATAYRARPILEKVANVHVIVPFKNQRELTLGCLDALQKQKNVNLFITFVNNQSSDLQLVEELKGFKVELLNADFPFNFSMLNNMALKVSSCPKSFDLVLFLNNDVILYNDAIFEMAVWASNIDVGAVGAQLHYPDGTIQHSGVAFDGDGKSRILPWSHTCLYADPNLPGIHNVTQTTNCVTGACMMLKKSLIEIVGGFDEDFYPIAFSDTNLCMKIRKFNLPILYTPHAKGVHYESVTRGKNNIEDYEASSWLHGLLFSNRTIEKLGSFYPTISIDELDNSGFDIP